MDNYRGKYNLNKKVELITNDFFLKVHLQLQLYALSKPNIIYMWLPSVFLIISARDIPPS